MSRPPPPSRLGPTLDLQLEPSRVLFEDDDIIAIDKPPGLPSQATLDRSRPHAARAVAEYLGARGASTVYVGEHHRLDVDTSGVLVFAKHRRANPSLSEQFRSRSVMKTYWTLARLETPLPDTGVWEVRDHLAEITTGQKQRRMGAVRSGGQRAETEFRLLALAGDRRHAWIEASPRTGRRHQIRVHLAEGGRPILGDALYGVGPTSAAPRLMLHAHRLCIQHPVSGEALALEAPAPADFLACAEALGLEPACH